MNIETRKLHFIEDYLRIQSVSIIKKLETLLRIEQENNITTHLSESEKKAIDEGLNSIKNGKTFSHKEVMNEMRQKYPNLVK
ncbi:MAG: hypothetical protein K8R37_08390 [Bacteroidales bacterium]|nr:hypothetical protein [Bacteroidales bacterium]